MSTTQGETMVSERGGSGARGTTGEQFVYFFGEGHAEGNGNMKDVLGGKGAGLAEMTNAGVPVPPGFTISTAVCRHYHAHDRRLPEAFAPQQDEALARLERTLGRTLGQANDPLLVSVRSGAKFSMPGMMDTILNLGLNDRSVRGLAEKTGNTRFAWDCYRRFVQMFASVVMDFEKHEFEELIAAAKKRRRVKLDTELTAADLEALTAEFKRHVRSRSGREFPQDPLEQLAMARDAVFRSWNNDRAIYYRKQNAIPDDIGTAVNVQAMVFGNMGETSGTGVGFTRNPSTGENHFYGEYLTNAQGEDVVAGVRTPQPIDHLEQEMPDVYRQLREITSRLEKHYRDIQDFEFTIQEGTLFLLQTRNGKRTAQAAVRIAVEMVKEGLINEQEAILRVEPASLDQLLHPRLDPKAKTKLLATGLAASPGAAVGVAVFDADTAAERGAKKHKVILVRKETTPDDIHGMDAAQGILTATGGMTSHAAVVARGMGKPCVSGAGTLRVDEHGRKFTVDGITVKEGDWITLDGSTGRVLLGAVPTIEATVSGEFGAFMAIADKHRRLGVRANADIPRDATKAREFGAEGIGLCRTEHMFFEGDRITAMREMIVAPDEAGRRRALAKLLPMQRADFEGIFEALAGYPVTIRLLDPPLHEFLPHTRDEVTTLAHAMKMPVAELQRLVSSLVEANPMLGHRGCRLGITYPEITEVQARAIFEAACRVVGRGKKVMVEVMIPLVALAEELRQQTEIVRRIAREVFQAEGRGVPYLVGTMIELPRAALTADEIAKEAEFFSFGTNDLTQTTFGLSRDDAGRFLPFYVEHGLLKDDPFQVLDQDGVGKLMELAVKLGRTTRSDLKVGICGEHGGEPSSVKFCHRVGMSYVSCSPFRIPIARLAAAQAALEEQGVVNRTRATV